MIQTLLIWSVAAPLAVMLAVLLVGVIFRRVTGVIDWVLSNGGVVVIALALGYGLAHIGLGREWRLSFPPDDVKMWLVYILPIVVLVSLFRSVGWMRWWVWLVVDILLFTGFCVILLWKMMGSDGGFRDVIFHAGGLGVVYGFFVLMSEGGARRLPALMFLFPLGLWVALCAVMFGMMASVNTGMQTGAIATAVGVVFVSVWLGRGKVRSGDGWSVVVPVILYLVMGNGMEVYYFSYAERAIVSLGLAGAGIVLSGLVVMGGGAWLRRRPKRGVIVLVMLMVGPAVGGAVVAYFANVAGL